MDKKIGLQVIDITNSQAQVDAFAIPLGEANNERQLPIVIGPAEAQAAALYLKGVKTPHPLTRDLFITSPTMLGVSLIRVLIYRTKDGIFCSYVYLRKDEEIICIDAWTSDAVALAVRTDCPILIYESILRQGCLYVSLEERTRSEETNNDEVAEEEHDLPGTTSRTFEGALEQTIRNENYGLAAQVRDQINSKNKNQ